MTSEYPRLQRGISRGPAFHFEFNGHRVISYPGETIATALMAAGQRAFRYSSLAEEPRGLFCGMGICFDCLVTVNGRPNVRACITPVCPGDRVEGQS